MLILTAPQLFFDNFRALGQMKGGVPLQKELGSFLLKVLPLHLKIMQNWLLELMNSKEKSAMLEKYSLLAALLSLTYLGQEASWLLESEYERQASLR